MMKGEGDGHDLDLQDFCVSPQLIAPSLIHPLSEISSS